MSLANDHQHLLNLAAAYQAKLSTYPVELFQQAPPIGGWSYSEVYFHIFDSSLLSLAMIRDCLKGKAVQKPTALLVRLILFWGSLPPIKYKAPKRLTERLRKINTKEAEQMIDQFLQQLEKEYPDMKNADPFMKTPHPRMGYLNTAQWLRFARIHLSHHLKQLDRIEKSF